MRNENEKLGLELSILKEKFENEKKENKKVKTSE